MMKRNELVSLFLLVVVLVGLITYTIYRETLYQQEITVVRNPRGSEGASGQAGETGRETLTGFREPVEVHYDVMGAYAGSVLISLVIIFYWMRSFLGVVRKTGNEEIGEIVRSGIVFMGAILFAIAGLLLAAIAVLVM